MKETIWQGEMLLLKTVERGFPEMEEEEAGLCLLSLPEQHRVCGLKGILPIYRILVWKILWAEEPGRL